MRNGFSLVLKMTGLYDILSNCAKAVCNIWRDTIDFRECSWLGSASFISGVKEDSLKGEWSGANR